MTDQEIIALCDRAGVRWLEPDEDYEDGGFPGSFDMVSMSEMRAIIAQTLEEAARIADGYPGAHCDDIARDIRVLIDKEPTK